MKKMLALMFILLFSSVFFIGCADSGTADPESSGATEEASEALPKDATEESDSALSLEKDFLESINFDNADHKGVCGADLYWLYKDNVLVIRGTGDLIVSDNFSPARPWKEVENNIVKIIIEEGCTSIGAYAFSGSYRGTNLASVTIPGTVTEIGEHAFSQNNNLAKVNIAPGVKTIGENAFQDCKNLKNINLPKGLEIIGAHAFDSCSIDKLTFPNSLTEIGDFAFSGNNMEKISLPDGLKVIGSRAFYGCGNLKKIKISPDTKIIYTDYYGSKEVDSLMISEVVPSSSSEPSASSPVASSSADD